MEAPGTQARGTEAPRNGPMDAAPEAQPYPISNRLPNTFWKASPSP